MKRYKFLKLLLVAVPMLVMLVIASALSVDSVAASAGDSPLLCTWRVFLGAEADACEHIKASGYAAASDKGKTIKADLFVDGDFKATSGSFTTTHGDKTANVSWSGSAAAGPHMVTIIGYRWEKTGVVENGYIYKPDTVVSGHWETMNDTHNHCPNGWIYVDPQNGDDYCKRWVPEQHICPAGYEYHEQVGPNDCRKMTYRDVYGWVEYARDSKKVEVVACYQTCDEVISLGKVYEDPVDVGDVIWGPWIDHLNGTTWKYGIQYISSAWTETFVDKYSPEVICRIDSGEAEGEREVYEEKCSPRWTGRFLQTYIRSDHEHYVTYCNLVVPPEADLNGDGKVSEKEARAWEWDDAYLAEKCSKSCESPTWQGDLDKREVGTFKEMKDVCGSGNLFGGAHYDTGCGVPGDVCDWLGQ